MATPVASTSAQPPPPTELSLTGISVTFLAKRPKKIKLTINHDGKDYAGEIDQDGSVRWTEEIRGMAGAKIDINMQQPHRRRWKGWKEFASVEAWLTASQSAVLDVEQRISVIIIVAQSHGGATRPAESNAPQDPVGAPERESREDVPQVSTVAEAVKAASKTVTEKTVIAEKLGKVWSVLEFLKAIGEPLKEIHPAVSIAITTVGALTELCEKQKACRDAALDLVDQFESFLDIQVHEEPLKKRAETRQAVKHMLESISEASKYICDKTSTGFRGVVGDIFGSEYKEKIAGFQKTFARAKEAFDRSVALTTFAAVDGIALTTQLMFLHEKLSECSNAHFASDGGCLEDTRADLRQRIRSWIDSTDEATPNIFWLYGKAGSGKSTVANTVAAMVEDAGLYLSCFFCKRDDPGLSSPRRLLPTLAYSVAQQHESYRAAITKLLQGPDGAGIATTTDVKTQLEKLFDSLLAQTIDPLLLHVIVVDALDECGTPKEQTELATCILALSRAVPWVKVFITSRNEPGIHQIFSQASDCISCNINEEKATDDDIRVYVAAQAQYLDDPLTDADVAQLVKRAEGLFIWCRTLFEYLRNGIGATSFLQQLLSGDRQDQSPHPWNQLYMLYDDVLDSAVGAQTPEAVSFMRAVLLMINVSAPNRPLSTNAIMSFLHCRRLYTGFSVKDADKIIKRLHSVLYVGDTANNAVRAHHNSFYDFLQWKASSESGWQSSGEVHALLAQACISILNTQLTFNICKIETAVLNKDVPDLTARVKAHISQELQYSSRFWFAHLPQSTLNPAEVEPEVRKLLHSIKLLFWVECSSLGGYLRQIQFTFRASMRMFFRPCPDITAAVEDACRFVSSFADAMDSIAHIYLSALWWLPENCLMYRNLGLSKKTSWHLIENKPKNWDTLVWRSGQIGVRSVAFSPDGRFVACGGSDGAVYIRDSQTGALEGEPLRGHQKEVYSIAYSPDGCFIASGSSDNTVKIWDARSGQTILGPLDDHRHAVCCVAYSPDGLFVASGSWDRTIRIWNAQTGEPKGEPLQHPNWVREVAYSPDGRFIASACDDQCVHVWDTSSHKEAVGPFQGHQSYVRSVAFSPDGRTIVSGSDDHMIRVWDAHTGQAIGEPLRGHTDYVNSVTYSPDGRFILSGSDIDGTVRLWDATSHTPIGEPLQTHSGRVWCVSYSSDGSLIASASDEGVHVWDAPTSFVAESQSQDPSKQAATQAVYAVAYSPDGRFIASGSGGSDQIRIWDAQTDASVDTPVLRHAGMTQGGHVRSIAYSRDGLFIVSGSGDSDNSSVCVLDAQTGATISGPLQGHSEKISSVAYSPDGSRVASASEDGTVRLWDAQTGAAVGEALQVGSPALSVAFSPDGHFFACSTDGGFIWIWNAHTSEPFRDPIQAHSDWVRSVVFSPDGRHIVSGSDDRSVRIWDAQTGEAFGGLLEGHQTIVVCVAYSPDGRFIASGSADETVIVWDAQNGLACGEPLRGHSNWVLSVAYSPDGHFLASGASDGVIYVRHAPNDRDDVETRWLNSCSRLDPEDGWVKDSETLLLWIPVPYRENILLGTSIIIPNPMPNITARSIDYRTLLRYSGTSWTDIISCFDE